MLDSIKEGTILGLIGAVILLAMSVPVLGFVVKALCAVWTAALIVHIVNMVRSESAKDSK